MTQSEWLIHYLLLDEKPRCPRCYDREWGPVDPGTFIRCYALRIDAKVPVNIKQKIAECSVKVGKCTCGVVSDAL